MRSRISELLAFYTHCENRRLNLTSNLVSSIPSICNTVGMIINVLIISWEKLLYKNLSYKITELLSSQKAVKTKQIMWNSLGQKA